MQAEILVLRLVHILGGVVWVGSMVFVTVFLGPALQQVGPAAGQVMGALQQRRMMVFMPVVGILTILSGLRLYWIMSDGFASPYTSSATGMTFGMAGLLAILAFIIGMSFARPAMVRSGQIAARMASASDAERPGMQAEMQRLRARGQSASLAVLVLLILAAVGMAVARYL